MRYLLVIILSLSFFLFPTQTYAHVLKEDGSIGVLLHINPNDDPIAGEKSEFYLNFKDTQNKFDSILCDCSVSILKSGKEIFSQPLFQSNTPQTSESFTYAFPEKDVYEIRVVGKPLQKNAFQPFTLNYDVRVDHVSQNTPQATNDTSYLPYVLGGRYLGLGAVMLL